MTPENELELHLEQAQPTAQLPILSIVHLLVDLGHQKNAENHDRATHAELHDILDNYLCVVALNETLGEWNRYGYE